MAKSLRDLGKPLTPEEQAALDQEKALADAKLMGEQAPAVNEASAAVELAAQPVSRGGQMPEVAVPAVELKAPSVPTQARETPLDFSSVGGHVDPMPVDAPAQDWAAKALEARGNADQVRLAAGIGRAGEKIGAALGGMRSDPSAYEALDQHAKSVEARPQLDMQLDEMSRKFRLAAALKDPNHPINQKARAATPKAFAAMLGESFPKMTADDLAKQFPVLREALKYATADEKNLWARQMDAYKMQNKNQMDLAGLEERGQQRGINAFTSQTMAGQGEGGLSPVDRRFVQTQLQKLGEKTAGFAELGNAFEQMDRAYPGIVSKGVLPKNFDISVTDRAALALPGGAGTWLASPKGIEFQKLLGTAQDLLQRARTGAALTKDETAYYDNLFSTGWMANPQAIGPALNSLAQLSKAKLQAIQAPYESNAQGLASMQHYTGPRHNAGFWSAVGPGGAMPSNPIRDAAAPAMQQINDAGAAAAQSAAKAIPAGFVKMIGPDGKKLAVPIEEKIQALKEGFTEVFE